MATKGECRVPVGAYATWGGLRHIIINSEIDDPDVLIGMCGDSGRGGGRLAMLVRDRTLPKTEYKGRPTEASDNLCPCRPCYNAHDCGYEQRVYDKNGQWVSNKHVAKMECATRYNRGCPHVKPEPEHIFTPRGRVCKRCHYRKPSTQMPRREAADA